MANLKNLSPHFTLAEACISANAIKLRLNNTPPTPVLNTMINTALHMEHVRELLGNQPISVSSWYRSPLVNRAAGSSDRSQHVAGEAVDFVCPSFGTPLDVCRKLIAYQHELKFDQLILEHTWVHISFAIQTGKPRGQVLSLLHTGGFTPGLTNPRGIPYK